jgi:hypothetical protein
MNKSFGRAAWLCALIAMASVSARAQVLYGSLTGSVTDPRGTAVPGATITVVGEKTNST